MNPEEKLLLERAVKLSEANNLMLRKLISAQRWSMVWGFIKILFIVIPLIVAYKFLSPQISSIGDTYNNAKGLLDLYQ